jgi:hypothetical protein
VSRLRLPLVVLTATAALVVAGAAQSTPQTARVTKLYGRSGPGFFIKLTNFNFVLVKRLKPGMYTFTIQDRSTTHDFHLKGPGVDKKTAIDYLGTKKWVRVKLKRGTYRYWCDAHKTQMHGSFKVV